MATCPETVPVERALTGGVGVLACWLEEDHGGLHYDEGDDVSWKEGKPDE